MMIFTVFTLAGIGLCIKGHKGWGIVCFVIFALFGFFMVYRPQQVDSFLNSDNPVQTRQVVSTPLHGRAR